MGSENGVGSGRRVGNYKNSTLKPSGMARAIRGALALTTVALAMSGSGAAFAQVGVCVPAGPTPGTTVNCDGVFNSGNTNVPISYAVDDLTLIIGAVNPATTVDTTFTSAVYLNGAALGETLINHADITATDAYSAVNVTSTTGDISVTTDGDIAAYNTGYPIATAIYADSTDGDIYVGVLAGAQLQALNSAGQSFGIDAYSQNGNVTVVNAGSIYTSATGNSFGIYGESEYGVVDVTSSGTITANGDGFVYGIYAHSYANIYVDNQNSINASTTASGFGTVYGVFAYTSDHTANSVTVDNSGYIGALNTGTGNAYGIYAYVYYGGDVTITHGGSISATTYNGDAYGIYATLVYGDANVSGNGDITVYADGYAEGIYVNVDGDGTASVSNGGAIDVTSGGSYAYGVNVYSNGIGSLYVGTSGSIDVTAYEGAYGIHAYSTSTGAVDVVNGATITVISYYSSDWGIYAGTNGDASVDNSGDISVTSYVQNADGIYATGDASASVNNDGNITVDASLNGTGINATSYSGDVNVTGGGTVTVNAGTAATGIYAEAVSGNVTVDLSGGSVYAGNTGGDATGIYASGYASASVNNDADITVVATAVGTGIYATSSNGDVTITGGGTVTVNADGSATGIYAEAYAGNVYITLGGGSVYAAASAAGGAATGIYASTAYGGGNIDIASDADVTANAYGGTGAGIYATAQNYGAVSITGSGNITATAVTGDTYGIYAYSEDGDVYVNVSGDIIAYGNGSAYGIHVETYGDIDITSGGAIDATSLGNFNNATGIFVYTCDSSSCLGVAVQNDGDITATAFGNYSDVYGIYVYAYGYYATTVTNDGSIVADALGLNGQATGIYVHATYGPVTVGGTGDITVSANNVAAYGIHVYLEGDYGASVTSGGAIDVVSGVGQASGIYIAGSGGPGDIYVGTTGSIDVQANTYAVGIHAYSDYAGDVDVTNGADITVTSTLGAATGIFTSSAGADTTIDNSGTITVTTYGYNGTINGIYANGYVNATVYNSGAITIDAQGVNADAYGIHVIAGTGDVTVDSSGSISATADSIAHAIDITANAGSVYVTTGGTLDATGSSAYGMQIGLYGAGNAYITSGADITAYAGPFGVATGIDVHTYSGNITLDNTGDIYAYSTNNDATGIHADSSQYGDIAITNTGSFDLTGGNDSFGIYALTQGDVSVINSGAIDVTVYGLNAGYGIYVNSYGAVTVDNSGDLNITTNGGAALGIYVSAVGIYAVSVNNDANIVATATVPLGGAVGIDVVVTDGALSITSAGAITAHGYASSIGILAGANGDGTIYISHGNIDVTSDNFYGEGILAYTSGTGGITVVGTGDVTVDAFFGANGIHAYTTGTGSVSVDSGGAIAATTVSGNANGIIGQSYGGDVNISATGASVDATSTYGNATGINANAYNDAYVYSSADILADAQGAGGLATGIYAYAYVGDATVVSGSITATSDADAAGIQASVGLDGNVSVTTTGGTIDVDSATGYAHGIEATAGGLGYVTVYSVADLDVVGHDGAYGILAQAVYDVDVYNFGDISTSSVTGLAVGIEAYTTGAGNVTIDNTGDITADGTLGATGIKGFTSGAGSITIDSAGATDVYTYSGDATGIFANSYASTVDINVTAGSIDAVSGYGNAAGIDAYAYGNATVSSDAAILADAQNGQATGIHAYSYTGNASVTSGGAITVHSDVTGYGIHASTGLGGSVYVTTSGGPIDVSTYGAAASAFGIDATATGAGVVTIYSTADIVVDSALFTGIGIYALSYDGDIAIDSFGDIDADGAQGAGGILAQASGAGSVYVNSAGDIVANAADFAAIGIQAISNNANVSIDATGGSIDLNAADGNAFGIFADAYGTVTIDNAAAIDATATVTAVGIFATGDGAVNIANTAAIDTSSSGLYGTATGIHADSQGLGDVYVYNGGPIQAFASGGYGAAYGIQASSFYGDLDIVNAGGIDAQSTNYVGIGILATAYYYNLSVDNSAAINASGGYDAAGMQLTAQQGDVAVTNSGAIVASGTDAAWGINAAAANGGVSVDNFADISATADDYAWGIEAFAQYDVAIYSSGDVTAIANDGLAYGLWASAGGDISIDDSGDIVVLAYDQGYGILASAVGDVDLVVSGDLYVVVGSSGAAYAHATGVEAQSISGYADFSGMGDVYASAIADADTGYAYAMGVHIDSAYAYVTIGGASSITASASGAYASAVGLEVNGGYALSLDLNGDISAYASGLYGEAVGVSGHSYVDVLAYNGGVIAAQFAGGYGTATGVHIDSLAGIVLYNFGSITATSDYYAVAVELDGNTTTTLFNQGLIAAYVGADYGVAIVSGDADDLVLNYGTVNGAVRTGDGDDHLVNAFGYTWNVTAAFDSDFGAGDDGITNYGTINMTDAIIDLGLPGTSGNYVCNYGVITVSGDNIIDLEGGSASRIMSAALASTAMAVPSTNPGAFYNYGLIDFQDGAPDDTLTIIGDFADPTGDGVIALDVSGLNGTGDLLYIDGSVISSTVNTLDIDLLDLPLDDGLALVPVVEVAGDSVSGNFVLGSVSYNPIPFIDTSISLVSNINTSNSSPDLFSLRVSMSADESGAIAAVLPAGVQLLMNDVVGSWHKRVEGIEDNGKSKFSLWARIYYNKGKVDPDFDGDIGGDFGFEQKNAGGEAGLDFAPNGKFSFGLILGRAGADQNLRLGFGSDKIQGNVTGGYGTYKLPRGFYFDLSHRRLKFDAELDTTNGPMVASGEARTSNAESGYSFNIGGFEVEGQVQLTNTKLTSLDSLTFDPSSTSTSSLRMLSRAAAVPPEFENDADLSSVKRVGVDVRKKWKSKTGTQWELHWTSNRIRETGGRNSFLVNNTIGGSTDIGGDSSLLDVGFTARRGLLLYYGALTWQSGGALDNFFGAQLGAKFTW